jgi:hypothetical protein
VPGELRKSTVSAVSLTGQLPRVLHGNRYPISGGFRSRCCATSDPPCRAQGSGSGCACGIISCTARTEPCHHCRSPRRRGAAASGHLVAADACVMVFVRTCFWVHFLARYEIMCVGVRAHAYLLNKVNSILGNAHTRTRMCDFKKKFQ